MQVVPAKRLFLPFGNKREDGMMSADGCLICQAELRYQEESQQMRCSICGRAVLSNARCAEGHFVCDACHEMGGMDYIETVCTNSSTANPLELANEIMRNPNIKMHGPEHHYLVPAVLLTAYYNATGEATLIPRKLKVARERAANILGGFCGFYGNCGAGVGTGIFLSIILNSTPVAEEEWRLSNLLTSQSLYNIALHGGPRCCKRDTFLSLQTAVEFVSEHLNVSLEDSAISCSFYSRNKQCRMQDCPFFPG
jgi:hypothetical protein